VFQFIAVMSRFKKTL